MDTLINDKSGYIIKLKSSILESDDYNTKLYKLWASLPSEIQKNNNLTTLLVNGKSWSSVYHHILEYLPQIIANYSYYLSDIESSKDIYMKIKKLFTKISFNDFLVNMLFIIDEISPGATKEYSNIVEEYQKSNKKALKEIIQLENPAEVNEVLADNYSVILLNISSDLKPYIKSWEPEQFIKSVKLTQKFPFIGMIPYKNYKTGIPHIKTHVSIPKKEIKEWIFKDSNNVREFKGVIIKIKTEYGYQPININRFSPKVSIKIQGNNRKCDEIIRDTKAYLSEFIKFYNGKQVNSDEIDISVSSIAIKIPFLDKNNLQYTIDLPKLKKYIKQEEKITIENTQSSVKFHVKDNIYITSENQVSVFGISNISKVKEAISLFIKIIQDIQTIHKLKLFVLTSNNKGKTDKNITNINPVDCQKSRQVSIYSHGNENTTYYNGGFFTCKNKDYPFFGFTSKGNVCCFKKTQVNKPIYLLKMNKNVKSNYSEKDSIILAKSIIKTDKPVSEFRLGVVNVKIKKFLKSYSNPFRLGNPNKTIISAISYALQKDIKEYLKKGLVEPIYRSLSNGEFYNQMPFNEWREIMANEKYSLIPEEVLIDFIEKSLKIQIQIATLEIKRVKTEVFYIESKYNKCYEKAVTLCKYIRKEGLFYEPIVDLLKEKIIYTTQSLKCIKPAYPYNIKAQYIDKYNKVEYLLTDKGVLPVSILNISSNPEPYIPMIISFPDKGRLTLVTQLKYLKELNITPLFQIMTSKGIIGLIVKSMNKTGIIPVTISKKPIADIPISYTFYQSNINDILEASYEIETITWPRYYKELFQRFELLLTPSIYKQVQLIVKDASISYNFKFKKLRDILKTVYNENTLLFKELSSIELPETLPKVRYTCIEEEFSSFCENKKLIIDRYISEAFIDRITTLFLIGYYPNISKKPQERKKINEYFIRPTEVIYTKKDDYRKLQKNQK